MRKASKRADGIPARLQQLADLAGSVVALAEVTGVSRRGLNDWLNDVRAPHPTLLHKICEITGADLRWLRDGEGDPPSRLVTTRPVAEDITLTLIGDPHLRSILQVDRNWVSLRLGVSPERLLLWNQPDDSMEPDIGLGDPVICRIWPKENPPPIYTVKDRYCVVRKNNEYLLRKLRSMSEGVVTLFANNGRKYLPESMNLKDIEIIAEALWGGRSLYASKIRTYGGKYGSGSPSKL